MIRGLVQNEKEKTGKEDPNGSKEEIIAEPHGGGEHERPVMGDIHTIAGGGAFSAMRKWYARAVMQLSEQTISIPTLYFTKEDLREVYPHDNDPMVISVIMRSRWVHQVLVDQVPQPT